MARRGDVVKARRARMVVWKCMVGLWYCSWLTGVERVRVFGGKRSIGLLLFN